jgi:hypothetical protein
MDEVTALRILVKRLQRELKEAKEENEIMYLMCQQAQADVYEAKQDYLLYIGAKRNG